jgi:histidine triad (HIT) family protein
MNKKTIFQKITHREIPADIVYEDEHFFAFLDINPVTKGHTLLITKEPYTWMHEAPDDLVGGIFIKAKEIILAMKKGIPCDFVQVGVVGNEVPHFHIHLIPRMLSEEVTQTNRPHTPYEEGEQKVYTDKIRNSIT